MPTPSGGVQAARAQPVHPGDARPRLSAPGILARLRAPGVGPALSGVLRPALLGLSFRSPGSARPVVTRGLPRTPPPDILLCVSGGPPASSIAAIAGVAQAPAIAPDFVAQPRHR